MNKSDYRTILLIESGDEAAHHIRTLKKYGFMVFHAVDRISAMEYINSAHEISLALINFEETDGVNSVETAEMILKSGAIPIVFLIPDNDDIISEKIINSELYGYIARESSELVLISAIENVIKLAEARKIIDRKSRILDENERTFAKIFNTIPVLMTVTSIEDGLFIEANDAFFNTFGYSRDEIIGNKSTELNIWVDADDRTEAVSLLKKNGTLRNHETKVYTKNGKILHGLFSMDLIDMNGERFMLSSMINITENKSAQESVKLSEEIFKKIFEQALVGIAMVSVNGDFFEVNSRFCEITGYPVNELVLKNYAEITHPDDLHLDKEQLSKVMKDEIDSYTIEKRYIHKDGHIVWVNLYSNVIRDEKRNIKSAITVIDDITTRKNIEENLVYTLHALEDIINFIPSGLFIYQYKQPDSLYLIKANAEAGKMTGINPQDFMGMEFNDIWPAAFSSGITEKYLNVIHTGINIELEDQEYEDSRVNGAFRIRAFNIPGCKLGIAFENVTKIKLAENALRESESHYHLLADHMSDAVWLMDLDLRTTYCSPSVEKLRGFTADEIIGMSVEQNVTGESFERALTVLKEEMNKVNSDNNYCFVIPIELEFIKKDGSTFWGDSTFTLIRGKDGKPESILGETRDITDRKISEARINKLLKEKEILLREVHHRIKNNMHTIASLLYLQADSSSDLSAASALTDAYNRVQSMMLIYEKLYVSSDFRDISAALYLNELIEGISSAIRTSRYIEVSRNIEDLHLNTAFLFPVGIIINELITNSFKYAFTDEKESLIHISLSKKEGNIYLVYRDNGVGIPASYFDSGQKGFGLSLVKILIEQLDGELDFKSCGGVEYSMLFPL